MTTDSRRRGRAKPLRGRADELSVLGRFIEGVRAGESRVLGVRGEPGVGKTALLAYLAGREIQGRLAAAAVGLLFAAGEPGGVLAGLPELAVEGLPEGDARALLDSVLAGPLDARVRDQIVSETRGNPLALLELPRGLTPAQLAGGFGLPGARPLSGRIEESFRRQLEALPPYARRLLQLAAADPSGDPLLVLRAAPPPA